MRRALLLLLVMALLPFGTASAHEGHKALEVKGIRVAGGTVTLCPSAQKSLGIETAEVGTATLEDVVTVPATVQLPAEARGFASSRVGGRVLAVHARPGDRVAEGQVLAELESPELVALEQDLPPADLRISQAERALQRTRTAVERGAAPGKDALPLEAELREARAEARLLGMRIEALAGGPYAADSGPGNGKSRAIEIHAPRAGIVVHADVVVGQNVEPTEHLFEIHDLSKVYLVGQVFEGDAARVAPGQDVRLRLASQPDHVFAGKVHRADYEVNHATHRFDVFVEAGNPDLALKPGVVGRMEIVVGRAEDAIVLPSAALARLGAETFAFVYDGEASRKATAEEASRPAAGPPEPATAPSGADHAPEAADAAHGGTGGAASPQEAKKPLCGAPLSPGEELKVFLRKDLVLGRERGGLVEARDGVFPGDRVLVKGQHELATFFVQGKLKPTAIALMNLDVQKVKALPRALDLVVRIPAEVVGIPDRRAQVSSLVSGKVSRFLVTVGQRVDKGTALVEIDSLELQGLFLDLITAEVRLASARGNLDRIRALIAEGATAAKEMVEAQAATERFEVVAQGARRRIASFGVEEDRIEKAVQETRPVSTLVLRAPMEGIVASLPAALGQVVSTASPVAEILDFGEVYVRGTVDSRDAGSVTPGRKARARLVAFPDRSLDVELQATTQMFDPEARVLSLYGAVPNPDGALVPGMTGDLFVVVGVRPEAMAVPRGAVLSESSGPAVVIADKDSFRLVPVRLGPSDDRLITVIAGVLPGDEVVTTGKEGIRTGIVTVR
jgi:cobalt-zinc-cadmium efflux system membrane fusion protein